MTGSTTTTTMGAGMAAAADVAETTASCMRATAELHSRLAAAWLDIFAFGPMNRPAGSAAPSVTQWSLEAMRLTAETTLRNIERCQDCARRAGGAP